MFGPWAFFKKSTEYIIMEQSTQPQDLLLNCLCQQLSPWMLYFDGTWVSFDYLNSTLTNMSTMLSMQTLADHVPSNGWFLLT